jgi:hypothetical protein
LFDLTLNWVIQFITVRAEEFDAVICVGIMGCGDDDTGVSSETSGDIGHAWGGQWTDEQNIDTHGENA